MATNVYIDGGHLSHATSKCWDENGHEFRLNVRMSEFARHCLSVFSSPVVKQVYYYGALPPDKEKYRVRREGIIKYHNGIRKQEVGDHNIIVKEGVLATKRCKECNMVVEHQKQVDTLMTMDIYHAIISEPDVSEIILVTGDSDFTPIVEMAVHTTSRSIRVHAMHGANFSELLEKAINGETGYFNLKILESIPGTHRKYFSSYSMF